MDINSVSIARNVLSSLHLLPAAGRQSLAVEIRPKLTVDQISERLLVWTKAEIKTVN